VQTLSSQPTINSLPPPKKPATFENPLTRPEIGPYKNHPLVQPQPAILSVPERQEVSVLIHPKTESRPVVSVRRELPDEIKDIFKTSSEDFADYAKNRTPKNPSSQNEILDKWDRALLLGEYPPEHQKPKRLSFTPNTSFVPKKTDAYQSSTAFPSRVMDEDTISPTLRKKYRAVTAPHTEPARVMPIVPKKPSDTPKSTPNKTAPAQKPILITATIPVKPKQPITNTTHPINSLPLPAPIQETGKPFLKTVPQKPKNQAPEGLAMPSPSMSETLVEKIIEGQMRGVFENAPPLLQKELEKMTVRDIIAISDKKTPGDTIENEVWKKRLREYLIKLRTQAISVLPDVSMATPTEGELVLDYVKRIYPILLKAQVTK
jgi:hypothetical protein